MTVPALPAASLVVIDDRPDLHVLLGRRRPGAFVGDMIVYPGGAVDDDDWRLGPALVPGATAPGLSAVDAAAYLHAAIRETREEVGLFPDPNGVQDGTAFAAVGHWTTPEEVPRRYDTRFFLARHPGGEARVADDELVAEAESFAESLASKPTFSLLATKTQVNAVMEEIAGTGRSANDADSLVVALHDEESRAASQRYLESRSRASGNT